MGAALFVATLLVDAGLGSADVRRRLTPPLPLRGGKGLKGLCFWSLVAEGGTPALKTTHERHHKT